MNKIPKKDSLHWADTYAKKIIRERGEKPYYTCASGITPSGTVHIGNFREIISVDIVVKALASLGKKTRFIYSWDDFDVFRKVPSNIEKEEEYIQYLRKPIVDIPDPYGRAENYARANEIEIEKELSRVGIYPSYIYQSKRYKNSDYAEGMRIALKYRKEIIDILNEHRSSLLPHDWYPISVFSEFTNKDTTKVCEWDGEWSITYKCLETGKRSTVDLRQTGRVKLLWRVDWPMRWYYENVDFEPAGKDHHSQGGSFDTAKEIATQVYNIAPPVTFQYDFIRVKGGSGKLSSSSGEVLSLSDVLSVYQPPIVRYLFAGTRPNAEFAISFDIDVIKIYEDYDRCERIHFGEEEVSDARRQKESRIYVLSQVCNVASSILCQISFRHLCSVLQIYEGNISKVIAYLKLNSNDVKYVSERALCVWNWIQKHAPEEFVFSLANVHDNNTLTETKEQKNAIAFLCKNIEQDFEDMSDKDINAAIYSCAREADIDPKEFFPVLYMRIIRRQKGPRLGSFFKILGKEKVCMYLQT